MNHLLLYLPHSAVCLAALYLVYWLFLRRETFFTMNRFFLVSAALLSILIPFIRFNLYDLAPVRPVVIYLDPVIITPEKIGHIASRYENIVQTIWIIYITGVIVFLTKFIFQLVQLAFVARRNGTSRNEGINLVFTDQSYSPFSFFNYVFVNPRQDKEPEISTIIKHEQIHVRQWHSIDRIIMELLVIVQWFNPFAWFIVRSVKTIHEFLADEGVLKKGFSKWDYQELLLTRASGIQINNLTNNFNISLLKTRIIMMTRTRSTVRAKWKIMLALPAFMVVVFLFSTSSFDRILAQTISQNAGKETTKAAPDKSDPKISDQRTAQTEKKEPQKQQVKQVKYTAPVVLDNKTTSNGEPCYTVVEKQPSFKGGQDGLAKFLTENIKYPAEAKEKGIQGKVFVAFVVMADGSVTDVKIIQGVGGGCDEEAMRVAKMMPKWNPGTEKGKPVNVAFNLPINFKLDCKEKGKGEKVK